MKYTFGKTKACEKLEAALEETPWASRRVSRLLGSYTSKLFNITGAKDPETVTTCMELLREQALKRVDLMKLKDPFIKSLTKNLIVYRYRVYRNAFESLIPAMRFIDGERKKQKGLTSGSEQV
jgi:hypothetical protein